MGLSADEKKTLEALNRKAKEPDPEPVSRSVRANFDLGDPKQVALAIKHGFLKGDDDDDDKGDKKDKKDKKDDDDDDTPKRGGYFGS